VVPSKPPLRVIRTDVRPPPERPTIESLYREYAPYVAFFGNRLLGRSDEVDDLVQEVFVAAAEQELTGEPLQIKIWLKRVAVHKALNRLRWRRVRMRFGFNRNDDDIDAVDPAASPEDRALVRQVQIILDQIPARERVAWVLRHLEREPLEIVAELCNCSLATAKRRIAAAQDKLRRAVGDE
jgi:RNA polymerase sigma-70 factor (ECF subfamily)